jgi:hypothetical protein
VIDAFSYNMKVSVVGECVFDRGQASHKINLFAMGIKYAAVISLKEPIDYIRGLPDNFTLPRFDSVWDFCAGFGQVDFSGCQRRLPR